MSKKREAILCFLIHDDQILLAESNYRPGKITWNGISGYVESHEKPEEAAVRELYEEIKVRVYAHDVEKVGVMHLYDIKDETREETLEITIFFCEKWQGEPTYTPGVRPRWFKISSIPYQDMFEDTEAWLTRLLDGEKLIIEVLSQSNSAKHQNEVKDVLIRSIF